MAYNSHNHSHFRRQAHRDAERKLHAIGGRVEKSDHASDVKMIKSAVRQHENQEHGGKHSHIKLKTGGVARFAEGGAAKPRLDRSGGSKKSGGKGGSKGPHHVNVIIAPSRDRPVPVPVPVRPPMGGAMPPRPPMPPPAPGSAPAGAPPVAGLGGMGGMGNALPRPPMGPVGGMPMRARGGRVSTDYKAGAGGGEGRKEKLEKYGKNADVKEPGEKGTGKNA